MANSCPCCETPLAGNPTECPECGLWLVAIDDGARPVILRAEDGMVQIAEGNPAGLELWRGRLGTAGIPAFILGNIQFDADRAPRMLVPEERLDAALRLLAEENNWNPLTLELYQRLFHRDPPESP